MENFPKISFIETAKEKVSLSRIFRDLGIPSKNVIGISKLFANNWRESDIIILAQGVLGQKACPEDSQRIKDFVKTGGICWVMHQTQYKGSVWLPQHLDNFCIENRYSSTELDPMAQKRYICPWILYRDHPIWHKPHCIDESAFVFWKVNMNGKSYRTSATHVVTHQQGWDIIAGYADDKIRLKDKAAIIMEAKYGKGLFFWTQVFSPQVVWNNEKSFEKGVWKLFLENILAYFADYKKRRVLKIVAEVNPWSLMAGKRVKIKIKMRTNPKIKRIILEILKPDGKKEKLENAHFRFSYIPRIEGTYRVKVLLTTHNDIKSFTHTFFKVTDNFTPFRFLTHAHFQTDWTPESLGYLKGACQRLGIDGVVLAGGLFYKNENRYVRIEKNELKAIDTPLVKFFPGEEIHCMHVYGREKEIEAAEGGPAARIRHATTMGCFNLYPYHRNYWHQDNLVKIHRHGGIAIVAHPYSDSWWMKPQAGHNFEGIEFDRIDLTNWDKMLKKGEYVVGVSGVDNISFWRLLFPQMASGGPNIGWFNEPFTYPNLIKTVLSGRVTKIDTYPNPVRGKDNYLWFDINGQVVGGTLYAVDRVRLRINGKSHFPLRIMRIVKGGNRFYKKLKINSKSLNIFVEEEIKKDTYYRIEIDSPDRYNKEFAVTTLTNPIFVKRINGPKGAYFYFQNDSFPVFDEKKKRWQLNFTQVKEVRFFDRIWQINLYEPGEKCVLYVSGTESCKVEVNGKRRFWQKNKNGEIVVILNKGNQKIRIF